MDAWWLSRCDHIVCGPKISWKSHCSFIPSIDLRFEWDFNDFKSKFSKKKRKCLVSPSRVWEPNEKHGARIIRLTFTLVQLEKQTDHRISWCGNVVFLAKKGYVFFPRRRRKTHTRTHTDGLGGGYLHVRCKVSEKLSSGSSESDIQTSCLVR